jgi:hypothetical protein
MVSFLIGVGTAIVATVIEVSIELGAEYKFWALASCILYRLRSLPTGGIG